MPNVTIDSHTLGVNSANAVTIADESEAKAGKDVDVTFSTDNAGTTELGYKRKGTFTGTATIVFESTAPSA